MRQFSLLIGAALCAASTAGSAAPVEAEYPHAVNEFVTACLSGELSVQAREAAVQAAGWQPADAGGLSVAKLSISLAIEKNYSFAKPQMAEVFDKSVDGHPARLVIATFAANNRYQGLCALIMRDFANAFTYNDALGDAFKAAGVKGKSVDLPHYFEWAGKTGPDNNPVRGEIFTRSQALGGKRDMHIYVAF